MDEELNKNGEEDWYTTTFSIPKWLGKKLKEEANEMGYRGMNMIVVVACTNYLLGKKKRDEHNKEIQLMYDAEIISEETKEKLWLN